MKTKIIGVSGRARAGKDTFANELQHQIIDQFPNFVVKRYAFADEIKRELTELMGVHFGVNFADLDGEEKEIYRPLLIGYGTVMRNKTECRHWWQVLEEQIERDNPDYAIISDVRFATNPNDEVTWIKKSGGKLVHICRYNSVKKVDGSGGEIRLPIEFGSEDEKANESALYEAADFCVNWKTEPEKDKLKEITTKKCNEFIFENINYFVK